MNSAPWVSKYRPKSLKNVVCQDTTIKVLNKCLERGDLPHLLLYGSQGTGKTSTILSLVNQLFGKHKSDRVLELNASNDRGINVVRNDIINFSRFAIGEIDGVPPYKVVILDEADAMTQDAQAALRQVIEDSSKVTRFCFICNYVNKIIDPIRSRCVKLKFTPVSGVNMYRRLKGISRNENLEITNDALNRIIKVSGGDMRRGIMSLQNLSYLHRKITVIDVDEEFGVIPNSRMDNVLFCIQKGGLLQSRKSAKEIIESGADVSRFIKQFSHKVLSLDDIDDTKKGKIISCASRTAYHVREGASEYIQIVALLSSASEVLQESI